MKIPKEYENPYDKSGYPKELIEKVAKIIHKKWQHDQKKHILKWAFLPEETKEINRQWAIKILKEIFQQ